MDDGKRIKVLYIQVPPGGGSLIALYELLKNLPKLIQPVVLCYYKNEYAAMLESVSRVIYLDVEKFSSQHKNKYSKSKLLSTLQLQYHLLKKYLVDSKPVRNTLYNIIQREQPNIIHHNNEIFLNRDAIRAGIKANIPQVVHERSLGNYGINYMNLAADKSLMKKVAARIDITKAVADHFDKLYPATAANRVILHDTVDTKKYFPIPANENLKTTLGINANDTVITSVGRIIKWKGQHVLIEAMHLLKDKLQNFKVLLVGTDDAGIGSTDYKNELQRLASSYDMTDKIIFTGNRDDVPELINLSDVIVHCSVKPEPQGLVVIEALLCNKPLIASGNGGSGELVSKYGGIALNNINAATLAAKLEDVLINKKVPVINHEKLKQDFDATQQLSVLIQLYNKVLA